MYKCPRRSRHIHGLPSCGHLLDFLRKYAYFFLFLLLESLSLLLLFRFNHYQGSVAFSAANAAVARVETGYAEALAYLQLQGVNRQLTEENMRLQMQTNRLREALMTATRDTCITQRLMMERLADYELIAARVVQNSQGYRDNYIVACVEGQYIGWNNSALADVGHAGYVTAFGCGRDYASYTIATVEGGNKRYIYCDGTTWDRGDTPDKSGYDWVYDGSHDVTTEGGTNLVEQAVVMLARWSARATSLGPHSTRHAPTSRSASGASPTAAPITTSVAWQARPRR